MHVLQAITKTNFEERWPLVAHEVERVVQKAVHGEFTTEDVADLVKKGSAFAAFVRDGQDVLIVCVWEMIYYPRMTAANIMCLGGKDVKGMWAEFGKAMKVTWKLMGASSVECSVSPAMAKVLRRANFITRPLYIQMRGEL